MRDDGIYTAEMGQPPMNPDGGSAPPKRPPFKSKQRPPAPKAKPVKKMAKGGSIDGCAMKGKTKGSMR